LLGSICSLLLLCGLLFHHAHHFVKAADVGGIVGVGCSRSLSCGELFSVPSSCFIQRSPCSLGLTAGFDGSFLGKLCAAALRIQLCLHVGSGCITIRCTAAATQLYVAESSQVERVGNVVRTQPVFIVVVRTTFLKAINAARGADGG